MSDIRLFLRYEISGIMMFIASSLLVIGFLNYQISNLAYIIKYSVGIVIILSLGVGWLAYQLFDELVRPRTNIGYFHIIKTYCEKNEVYLKDEQYVPLIDFCLKDAYKIYPHLPGTFAGYWDNYYARCVVGWGVLLSSLFTLCLIPAFTNKEPAGCNQLLWIITLFIILLYFYCILPSINAYIKKQKQITDIITKINNRFRIDTIIKIGKNPHISNILILFALFSVLYLYFQHFIIPNSEDNLNIPVLKLYLLYLASIVFIGIKSSRIRDEWQRAECDVKL